MEKKRETSIMENQMENPFFEITIGKIVATVRGLGRLAWGLEIRAWGLAV